MAQTPLAKEVNLSSFVPWDRALTKRDQHGDGDDPMGTPIKITLSSSGISSPQNLDWMASKYLSFGVTGSSSGTFSYSIEGCLDDLEQTASTAVVWFTLSSGSANSSIAVFQGPLAGIRLNLASASSASVTLRALQGVGW
jgi:hypothetical protein